MLTTFILLTLAFCMVWIRPVKLGANHSLMPWVPVFALSVVSGLYTGILAFSAMLALVIFFIFALQASKPTLPKAQRLVFSALTFVFSLALAMHLCPGFHNPVLVKDIHFSSSSAPFTQYANFDKMAVGLFLIAFLCKRARALPEWGNMCMKALPVALLGTTLALSLALAIGYIQPDYKLPPYTATFLWINLFSACAAEEAFFRGFLQDRLERVLRKPKWGWMLAIAISGCFFGLAHIGGGLKLALLATVAGLAYGYAYHITKKIEAAILVHFLLNAIHFIFFTYPYAV